MTFRVDEVASGAAALRRSQRAAAARRSPSTSSSSTGRCRAWTASSPRAAARMLAGRHLPPVVMVTAYGREEVLKRGATRRDRDVLIKPVTPSLLFDTPCVRCSVDVRR